MGEEKTGKGALHSALFNKHSFVVAIWHLYYSKCTDRKREYLEPADFDQSVFSVHDQNLNGELIFIKGKWQYNFFVFSFERTFKIIY